MPGRRTAGIAALAAAVVAVQLAATAAGKAFYLTQLTMAAYATVVVLGLCLLMGYAGQASLGQAGFCAIGGYAASFLTTFDLGRHPGHPAVALLDRSGLLVTRPGGGGEITHVHPWAAFALGVGLAVAVAWVIARPVFRLRGHYLAMATLGFGIIVHRLVLGAEFLGGADGISDVPGLPLPGGLAVSGRAALRVGNYYVAWGLLVAALWALLNLIDSRVGRALRAVHGSENAASAVGVPIARFKTRTFVLAAGLAAASGVLLAHYTGQVGPSEASVHKSVRYVAIVAAGGMANLAGTALMGVVLTFLSLRGVFGTLDDLVFGVILLAIMLFAPEGVLGGGWQRIRAALRRAGKGRGAP